MRPAAGDDVCDRRAEATCARSEQRSVASAGAATHASDFASALKMSMAGDDAAEPPVDEPATPAGSHALPVPEDPPRSVTWTDCKRHATYVNDIAVLPSGLFVSVAAPDPEASVNVLQVHKGDGRPAHRMWSPCGEYDTYIVRLGDNLLLAGDHNGNLGIMDAESGNVYWKKKSTASVAVTALARVDHRRFAVARCSGDPSVELWSYGSGRQPYVVHRMTNVAATAILAMTVDSRGYLYLGSEDGSVSIYSMESFIDHRPQFIAVHRLHLQKVKCLSAGLRWVASGDDYGGITVYRGQHGRDIGWRDVKLSDKRPHGTRAITAMVVVGDRLITTGSDRQLCVCALPFCATLFRFDMQHMMVGSALEFIAPDGVVVGSRSGEINILSLPPGAVCSKDAPRGLGGLAPRGQKERSDMGVARHGCNMIRPYGTPQPSASERRRQVSRAQHRETHRRHGYPDSGIGSSHEHGHHGRARGGHRDNRDREYEGAYSHDYGRGRVREREAECERGHGRDTEHYHEHNRDPYSPRRAAGRDLEGRHERERYRDYYRGDSPSSEHYRPLSSAASGEREPKRRREEYERNGGSGREYNETRRVVDVERRVADEAEQERKQAEAQLEPHRRESAVLEQQMRKQIEAQYPGSALPQAAPSPVPAQFPEAQVVRGGASVAQQLPVPQRPRQVAAGETQGVEGAKSHAQVPPVAQARMEIAPTQEVPPTTLPMEVVQQNVELNCRLMQENHELKMQILQDSFMRDMDRVAAVSGLSLQGQVDLPTYPVGVAAGLPVRPMLQAGGLHGYGGDATVHVAQGLGVPRPTRRMARGGLPDRSVWDPARNQIGFTHTWYAQRLAARGTAASQPAACSVQVLPQPGGAQGGSATRGPRAGTAQELQPTESGKGDAGAAGGGHPGSGAPRNT